MSWMDSWSRPSKHAVTPPPLYLTVGEEVPYCRSCGRIIGSRKSQSSQEVKYCSTRCRNNKPGPLDRRIEAAFSAMLNDKVPQNLTADAEEEAAELLKAKKSKKKAKGDPRMIVECSEIEAIIFLRQKDPEKVYGRRRNRAARGVVDKPGVWRSVDMVDEPEDLNANDISTIEDDHVANEVVPNTAKGYGNGKVRPPQGKSDVNGSIGGEKGWAERIEETEDMKSKRIEGQRRAEEREMVRRAARRGCAFGFVFSEELTSDEKNSDDKIQCQIKKRRKCEAVMKGAAVEPSFAKGEWGIRWRDKN